MLIDFKGENEYSLEELEALFEEKEPVPLQDEDESESENEETPQKPVVDDTTSEPDKAVDEKKLAKKEITKGVAERIKKVRLEERNAIAKRLGYDSYDSMLKAQEDKLIKDKGYDPDDLAPIVEEIVKTRLENDPRIQELENIKKERMKEFAKRELAEISKLTGGEINTIDELPKDVLEEWAKTGSLKNAFLLLKGEEYIARARAKSVKGGTAHLQSAGGTAPRPGNTRPLTDEERRVWKLFHPTISDEELNKKTMPIN